MGAQVVPRGRAVHPREGGERCDKVKPALAAVGSSPRGRGTPRCPAIFVTKIRFIPAWAGNAWGGGGTGLQPAVHPRVGGERCGPDGLHCGIGGSSPRGRGTRLVIRISPGWPRFIPAWAGNAPIGNRQCSRVSVHPRVGGERSMPQTYSARAAGSSPRGRGTPIPEGGKHASRRFIPAWAGNANHLGMA